MSQPSMHLIESVLPVESPGCFVVVRAFLMAGKTVSVGETIELSDGTLITDLVSNGKIRAADQHTAARLVAVGSQWSNCLNLAKPVIATAERGLAWR